MAEILQGIGMIARTLDSASNVESEEAGLTGGQYLYLVRICESPEIIQEKLAEMIKADCTAAVRVIKKLGSNGMVERLEDKENKKIKKLYPTEKGVGIYLFTIRENSYSNVVALNGPSDEEAKQLEYLLNKVCKNVSEDWNFVKKGNERIY